MVIPLKAPELMIIPLIVFVAVAPVMVPERPRVVTPDTAPAAVILIVPLVRKLLNPVPNVMPLKALLVMAVTLPKLTPVMVLALELALVAPTKDRSRPLTFAAVMEALEFVTVKAEPVPVTELE